VVLDGLLIPLLSLLLPCRTLPSLVPPLCSRACACRRLHRRHKQHQWMRISLLSDSSSSSVCAVAWCAVVATPAVAVLQWLLALWLC
jgi:hypothetical protein